uniref:Putative sulfotransferase sult n=1 Tax=Corethrella appendiculata TaxID=1370023 RepID=U5ENI8_9DIPT
MSFQYIDIDDPTYEFDRGDYGEKQYLLVKSLNTEKIPIDKNLWTPKPCVLSMKYQQYADKVKNMEVKADDVWLITYPKSGTTWAQEMTWLICNDLNFEESKKTDLIVRFPFLELTGIRETPFDSFEDAMKQKSPRFIKTHLPVTLLPDQIWTVKPKIIYVKRNPKSVAVSYYHHQKLLHNYVGTMEDYVKLFINDRTWYSPFFEHVSEYNQLQGYDNLLLFSFEDMKKDLKKIIGQVCHFFNKSYSDEKINELCAHLSFDSMKQNKAVNVDEWVSYLYKTIKKNFEQPTVDMKFVRKGKVDGWKDEMSQELSHAIDEWSKRKHKELGLNIPLF